MKFLFVSTKSSVFDIPFALKDMGHDVRVLDSYSYDPLETTDEEHIALFRDTLYADLPDYVISSLFVPALSDVCSEAPIPYISWCYDSPLVSLFHESVLHETNRIFIFDHAFYERLVKIQIPHVYYMPLAANTNRINQYHMTEEDQEKYRCDISFVGTLYTDNTYNALMHKLPPELLLPLNRYLMQHLCDWHTQRTWPTLSDACVRFILNNHFFSEEVINDFELPASYYLGCVVLSRKLAEMERITCLNTLAEQFPVDLYTYSQSDEIGALRVHPPVDYYLELGKVHSFSKINLNFTLPSIETGVPQRIFDIMAYGGFVLSNYQPEFDTLFTPGYDIAVFRDLGELKEQAAYYLSHEKERVEIAVHGYQTVNRLYSYVHQLNEILSICEKIRQEEGK